MATYENEQNSIDSDSEAAMMAAASDDDDGCCYSHQQQTINSRDDNNNYRPCRLSPPNFVWNDELGTINDAFMKPMIQAIDRRAFIDWRLVLWFDRWRGMGSV
jgi:hypothetical protein